MKKITSLLLAALLLFTCACAMGEEVVHFVEGSRDFDIQMPLPEGAKVTERYASALVSLVHVEKEGIATVIISIAPSELYDKQSMNDLTEEEIETLKATAGSQYAAPEITVDVTPSGNKYIHVCSNGSDDIDAIFTLYMGYFVELTQWHEDYAKLTDADTAFLLELLHNIEFVPEA